MPEQNLLRLFRDPGYRARWVEKQLTLPLSDRDLVTTGGFAIPDASFSGWTFPGGVNFYRVQFPPSASFPNCTFFGTANFDQAHFSGDVTFKESIFHEDAVLTNVRFNSDACFDGIAATKSVTFNGARISGKLSLASAVIFGRLSLDGSYATYPSDLTGLTVRAGVAFQPDRDVPQLLLDRASVDGPSTFPRSVSGSASLSGAKFSEEVEFGIFGSDANFQKTNFAKGVRFRQSVNGSANFTSVHFCAGVRFEGDFGGGASFKFATFDGPVDFPKKAHAQLDLSDAVFESSMRLNTSVRGKADLTHATFRGEADFAGAVFDGDVALNLTLFLSRACFNSARFCGRFDLREARFRQAPEFHDSEWASPPQFSVGLKFLPCFPDIASDHAESAYVTLKRLARKSEAHSEERRFFALEARSRSYREGRSARLLAWLYGATSDFGQSVARPLGLLVLLAIAGISAVYLPAFSDAPDCPAQDRTIAGLIYGARQSLPIFYPVSGFVEKMTDCFFPANSGGPPPARLAIGAIHALLALALLFLIGLAIRNRFRLQ